MVVGGWATRGAVQWVRGFDHAGRGSAGDPHIVSPAVWNTAASFAWDWMPAPAYSSRVSGRERRKSTAQTCFKPASGPEAPHWPQQVPGGAQGQGREDTLSTGVGRRVHAPAQQPPRRPGRRAPPPAASRFPHVTPPLASLLVSLSFMLILPSHTLRCGFVPS